MTEMVFQRYCAIEGRRTEKRIGVGPKKSCFFAYAFEPPYGDIISRAAEGLEARGFRLEVPKRTNTERGLLFCGVICPMMMQSKVVVGEVTDLNQNVAFELGYAEGLNKLVYLFRNTTITSTPSFLDSAGLYINEYELPAEIVEHVASREAEFDLPPEPLFDGRGITPTEKTVALLLPRNKHFQELVEPELRRCVANHKLSIAEPQRGGIGLQATYRTLKGAEWALGVLAGDNFAGSRALNAEVAYLLGLATASGKKVVVLQQEPVKKPMIDLAGLQERFTHVADLRTVLARRLDAAPTKTIERMDFRPGSQDGRDLVREFSRDGGTAAMDFFASLTGETRESQMVSQAKLARERRAEPPPTDDDEFELTLDSDSSAAGSDITLGGGDSGINLSPTDSGIRLTPADSGLSLEEEPLELAGSAVESLELPADDDFITLDEPGDEPTRLKVDDDFLLTPADDYDDDDESGEQVIALEDSESFDTDPPSLLQSDSFAPVQTPPRESRPAETSSGGGFFGRLFGRKKKP